MLARLEIARARQRAFVADAAQELRRPLTGIQTELEVAQRMGALDPDEPESIARQAAQPWPQLIPDLLAETQRLGRLVDDLLLMARADDAGRPLLRCRRSRRTPAATAPARDRERLGGLLL
jgi:signal transduction histidine kinase